LKNRNVRIPYIDFGVFVIQEWRKIGIEAEHRPLETAAWFADGGTPEASSSSSTGVQLHGRPRSVPRPVHHRGTPKLGSLLRSRIDDLFARQTRALDPASASGSSTRSRRSFSRTPYHIPGSGGRGAWCTGRR
jgi:peptide/nickel transport system substrate-binding protein